MTIIVRLPVVTYGIARYLFISRLLCHVFERSLWPLSPPRSRALDIACLLLPLHLEHRHVQRLSVSLPHILPSSPTRWGSSHWPTYRNRISPSTPPNVARPTSPIGTFDFHPTGAAKRIFILSDPQSFISGMTPTTVTPRPAGRRPTTLSPRGSTGTSRKSNSTR